MPGEPDEVYQDHGVTIEQWIKGKTPNYKRAKTQPMYCSVNGVVLKPVHWNAVVIGKKDNIEFRVVPHGVDPVTIAIYAAITVALSVAAVKFLSPDIPTRQGQGNQGSSLDPASANANEARLGQGVPELLGYYIRYPDYLNQPRTFYEDRTTQVIRLMLAVGVGEYEINADTVKIGETPISDIDGATFTLFPPGADVSGVANYENWFQSPEVGATTGASGIRLKGITFDERTYSGSATASGVQLSGVTVNAFWSVGLEGSITLSQSITVTAGGASADVFTGAFQHLLAGMTVNVESNVNVNGTYVVTTINGAEDEITLETTGGSPITTATAGAGVMSIDKAGTKYELTAISGSVIDVQRILTSGANDPDWTLLPATGLTVEILWEAAGFTTKKSGPYTAVPQGEATSDIEIDIFCPQGLGTIDGETINSRSRTISIEWREVGSVTFTEQTFVVSGATRDQLGFTFAITLPSAIRPEVRVGRVGAEDVAITSLDRIELTALRAKLPTVSSYADITTMAVTIVGSDEIASQSNNRINIEATRKLPVISGGTFTAPVATRDISAAACYVAKSLGYEDDQLDLAEFERYQAIWTPRGDTFDYVFSDTTAKDAIDKILRAGFAEPTLETGVITPVRDEPRTVFEQGYSPENMTGDLQRTFQGRQVDESDGVEVEYIDGNTWTTETVQAFLPGDIGQKLDKIKLDGVTDRTRAWRIGMRRRRALRYRRWNYEFGTELDALNSQYLSYVPLLDDVPGYGKVSILQSISADRITVSEPMVFESGKTHVVAYRDQDGNAIGPFTATEGPDEYTILVAIPEPWPAVLPATQEATHIYFGTTERWHFPALITEITPSGPLEVSVSAVNYDVRVYADDNNPAPV